ncbi:MAG TPA: autotransporter-associated beta strand repeat-containing protein [Verrucomicrobiae bacterium]
MKIKHVSHRCYHLIHSQIAFLVLSLLLLSTAIASAQLVPLYWDAGNTNNGATIDAGGGNWDTATTNLNWNDGSGNQTTWIQYGSTASKSQAIFGGLDGVDGSYPVNVDAGQVAVSNILINADGYDFYGSPIYIAPQAGTGNYPTIHVADGKSVTFTNLVTGVNYKVEITLGANGAPASASFKGGLTGTQWSFSSTNGSVFYLGGNTSYRGFFTVNGDVRMTNGALTVTAGTAGVFEIGRPGWFVSQATSYGGSFTLDGPNASINQFGPQDYMIIGRGAASVPPFTSTLTVQNGATLYDEVSSGNSGIAMPQIGSGGPGQISIFNVYGGAANLGYVNSNGTTNDPILLQYFGSWPGQVSLVNQTNGVINAWTGIQFGGTGANRTGGSAIVTNSGGYLYLGSSSGLDGLRAGAILPPTNVISFSGGTVGALQSWSGSALLPVTLGTQNGNITFQCADAGATPHDITLNGALIGSGGFYKTGAGNLILNGVNTYTGSTVVSNGILQLTTTSVASSNGPITLDGSAGSPELRLIVSHQGQYWSADTMTFASGSPALDLQYGQIVPSKTVAPVQANGDLNFTATPNILVTNAGALVIGTYPLITYTGTSSGTAPTTVTLPTSGYCSGYLSNSITAKTLYLVITSSTVPSSLAWATCDGAWDFATANWTTGGGPLTYHDGETVLFDDTAPCLNPAVTLNTSVSPGNVVFNNLTNSFTISGTGNIAMSSGGDLELVGGGTVTIATTNTYSGGTVVSAGSLLNINSGGSTGGTPVGTGTLTLNNSGQLGNTCGSAVVLQYPVPEVWNGNFNYVGNNDLNLGSGSVALAANTTINVATNNLTIGGPISDGGAGKLLTKTGNGILTLAANNTWNGLQLQAGQINFGSSGAAGSSSLTISGGSVDNVSGSPLALSATSYNLSGLFTVIGTSDLDFSSTFINASISGFTVNVISNTWITDCIGLNNSLATKTGNGTWRVVGLDSPGSVKPGPFTVNQGVLDMARLGGTTVVGGGGGAGSYGGFHGLVVNSNAVAMIDNYGEQIAYTPTAPGAATPVEVVLNGGILDMNGYDLQLDLLALNNGVLRNSAPGTSQVLTIITNQLQALFLTGTNCQLDVPPPDAAISIYTQIRGSGTLVKTGSGTVVLLQDNSYTGNITIDAGTLTLTYPDIAPTATVTIAGNTNAVLDLNFANSDTNMVSGLVLNGVPAAAGLHNAGTDPTYLSGNGSLLVNPVVINPLPGTVGFSVSGGALNLAWPTNAGWLLQAQTNSVRVGISSNWVTVPGSDSMTNLSVPVSPANGATFYRLIYP